MNNPWLERCADLKYGTSKVVHQIFLKISDKSIEDFPVFMKCMEKTKKWCKDNGWGHKLWTEIPWDICNDDDKYIFTEGAKRCPFLPCDYLRLVLLDRYGGIYIDLDNNPTDKLIEIIDDEIIIGLHDTKHISNDEVQRAKPRKLTYGTNVIKLTRPLASQLHQFAIDSYYEKEKIKVYETWIFRFLFQSVGPSMFKRFMKLNNIPMNLTFYEYFDEYLTNTWKEHIPQFNQE